MPARPYWQGQIRLALVSIPVEIFSATKSGATIAFHQIHEPSGKRIHYEKVVDGIGPVDPEEIVKGYEVEKGEYVLLEEEEIEGVALESRKTLELNRFVDVGEIDAIFYDKAYYVVPSDTLAEEAFVVLREALRKTRKIGLGQLALRGREYVVSLKPCGRGMVLETLKYSDEVNQSSSYFRGIGDSKPDADLLDLATSLIEKKAGAFDADDYHDRYVDALRALIAKKQKSKSSKLVIEDEESTPAESMNVVDLMKALKKSLDGGGGRATSKAPAAKKPAAKAKTTKPSGAKAAAGAAPARTRKRA
ncbi:Ku protein [Sphingobium subterraneum]|uniref:Non-homologous end joining protein Ku n=1 Tax=Sphingobium subterraneum TaxID=627688 RepID=A0A841J491_9SPHN|nr:Ku protein [Sphingobium subterraneum]MBB6125152.1 DNA end-binding protein Ku [Sphingobium subterraneum]